MDDRLSPPLEAIDHVRGERGAELELVMYGDFQCPFCLGAQAIMRRVRERLGNQLLFGFRHLPIPERHPLAQMAAEASESAAAQGQFWAYHDALFAAQSRLSLEVMLELGRDLGLDAGKIADDLGARSWQERVLRDLQSAEMSGATGTPSFYVNGRHHFGAYDAGSLIEALGS